MLIRGKDIVKSRVNAVDGQIGTVDDLLFNDERWVVRYLVVETGGWLTDRRVLISPISVDNADWNSRRVLLVLTREQVRNSPDLDMNPPISRQREIEYYVYYGYPFYWAGTGLWGSETAPRALAGPPVPPPETQDLLSRIAENADPHLWNTADVVGYHLQALDGECGHIDDVLVDDETWSIAYFVIDTSNWMGGDAMLIAPDQIASLDPDLRKVNLTLTREAVKRCPRYQPGDTVRWEDRVHAHR